MKATDFNKIFDSVVEIYHQFDDVNKKCPNPYKPGSMEFLLFQKCWIDAVQWHLEDIIRDPAIDPAKALDIKRWIDRSNQERTDTVEYIDSFLLDHFKDEIGRAHV